MLSGCHFGPSKSILFYKAFIRSSYEYANSSFANISKAVLFNIHKFPQNFHLRKALGLVKSTPINIIYQVAAELPSIYRIEFATAKELAKIFAFRLPAASLLLDSFCYSKIYFKYKY